MKKTITLSLFFILIVFTTKAQLGIKGTTLSPGGDIYNTHDKGYSYEIYFVTDEFNGRLQGRAGFFHASLSPGLDTFRTTVIRDELNGKYTLLPAFVVYDKFKMNCIYIDQSFRFFDIKNFELYAGLGIIFGWGKMEYDRTVETEISETNGIVNPSIGGLRGNIHLAYSINGHVQIYAEALRNVIVATDWSNSYAHNTFGIGINVFIKSRR